MPDVFERHPRPWRVHEDYPRPTFEGDEDGIVLDAHGRKIVWCSEFFAAERGVVEAMVAAINATQ